MKLTWLGFAPKIPLAGAIVRIPLTIEAVPVGGPNACTGAGGGSKLGGILCGFMVFATTIGAWEILGTIAGEIIEAASLLTIGVSTATGFWIRLVAMGSTVFFGFDLTCINLHEGFKQPFGWLS